MRINDYIRQNTQDTIINNSEFNFNTVYKKYIKIKDVTFSFIKEQQIIFFDYNNGNYNLLDAFDNDKLSFVNIFNDELYKNDLDKINNSKDLCLYILIACISNAAKAMASNFGYQKSETEIFTGNLKTIIKGFPVNSVDFIKKPFEEFNKIINAFLDKYKDIGILHQRVNYQNNVLKYEVNCPEDENLFFKFFLLELTYYSYSYIENPELEKICPICRKEYYTKGKSCNKCAKEYVNHRKKYNAKCSRRREKIKYYLNGGYDISPKLRDKAESFIYGHSNRYFDLKQLEKLLSQIEKEQKN